MKRHLIALCSVISFGSVSAELTSGQALEVLRQTNEKAMVRFDRCVPLFARECDEDDETVKEHVVYTAKAAAVGAVLYGLFAAAHNQWPAHNNPRFFKQELRPELWMKKIAGESPARWGALWGVTSGGFAGALIGVAAAIANKVGRLPSLSSDQLAVPVLMTLLSTWILSSAGMPVLAEYEDESSRRDLTGASMSAVYLGGIVSVLGLLGYIADKRKKQGAALEAERVLAHELLDEIVETDENREALAAVREALAHESSEAH